MRLRVGKVTNIDTESGKVRVNYEDEDNATLKLYMMTFNGEYSMPKVGDMVVTLHMENGSSKGFCLGTYYGGTLKPKTGFGYRKDFPGGSYVESAHDEYLISAQSITLDANEIVLGDVTLEDIILRIERLEDALNLPHTL